MREAKGTEGKGWQSRWVPAGQSIPLDKKEDEEPFWRSYYAIKESFQEARGFAKLSKECVCGGAAGGGGLYVRDSLCL